MRNAVDQWYLNRYGREPLLTVREELILSKQIHEAAALREVPADQLTPEQRHQLRIGERARQRMIRGNMRLAVNVALKYMSRCRSLELADLVQEAMAGLGIAVERFDYTKGYKFSTYAYWWVRQAITRAIVSRDTLIRVPQHSHDEYVKVKGLIQRAAAVGETLSLEQAAAQTGASMDNLRMAIRAEGVTSLNRVAIVDGDCELIDLVASPEAEEPEGFPLLRQEIRSLVSADYLSPMEVEVITGRYGLDNGEPRTLLSIAQKHGLSRERIRQIEAKALRRLRFFVAEKCKDKEPVKS